MTSLTDAVHALQAGSVIAYPTEAVWGLGCDPFSASAVEATRQLKKRPLNKGLILLVRDWLQAESLIDCSVKIDREPIEKSWPGPVTWVFPAAESVPDYLQVNGSIALRMPSYPSLQYLLSQYGKPLVSTSANVSGKNPAKTHNEVKALFPDVVVCPGECEGRQLPSAIYDAVSGCCLRA
jgi:L-threonylcarbamoyladenylate synthase